MTTQHLIDEAASLPIEERAMLADFLLRSLNQPESAIDDEWIAEAHRRLAEIRSGGTIGVAGAQVFERAWKRFGTNMPDDFSLHHH